MATRVPARLTAAQGRRFGFTVGGAFVAIGALLLWRGRTIGAPVAFGIGTLLIAAALTGPTRLGPVERGWMRLAHLISRVTTPIFMGIVYFVVMMPIGFVRRRMGSPIVAASGGSRWEAHTPDDIAAERMEHQF